MTAQRRRPEDLPGLADSASLVAGGGAVRAGEQEDSAPAVEAEAAAGADASRIDVFDQALAAATRERDRALDKATTRLASVTAGGYLEYDRSVSVALAAYESAWHNARTALASAGAR